MKKIFTLMLSVALVSVAFAQHGKEFNRHKKYDRTMHLTRFDIERRNNMIAKVNFEYDRRIFAVKESHMRLRNKQKEIRRLERERKDRIQMIYARFDGKKYSPRPHRVDGYVIH